MRQIILIFVALAIMGGSAMGGRLTTVTEKATAPGVKIVDGEIKLSVGEFNLYGGNSTPDLVATIEGDYDESRYLYDYSFDPSGKRADLLFSSRLRGRLHTNIDGNDNRWELNLSPDVEWRLKGDIGAAKATLDLGGLSVSELVFDVGAADARIDFSTPNKTTLNYFKISAGACDLKMNDLGNARFDRLEFDGGVGSFRLDFSGDFDYRADARIEVGLGSIHIIIPSEVGVRLETSDNFLSSIKFSKRVLKKVHEDEDVYETDNFDTAKGQLVLRLDIGMGSADIEFR
ncbi:MAG: hypothetical protein E4G91_05780 [Candidatus Zixiibacteriota bacterium]|nr:MAG: hypothetical protein E4G91_05780 [candidate division Zixibacteria bacterium]